MSKVSSKADRVRMLAGPAVGIPTLLAAAAGLQAGIVDETGMAVVAALCVLFMLMPAVRWLPLPSGAYATILFAALHAAALHVGMTGAGLLHPAGYFSTVLPVMSAVLLGRTAGLVNGALAVAYVGVGFWKYLHFPSPMEAEMTLGAAIVQCVAMLATMLLALGVALLFLRQSRAFARRQRQANARFDQARAEISEALRNMSNGLVMVAGDGTIRLYNERVLELLDLAPDKLAVGMPLARFLRNFAAMVGWDEARTQRIIDNHARWMAQDATVRIEHHFDDGRILSIACRPTPQGGAILTYDDVTEVREGEKKIAHMAFHDALTGLPNRRSFTDRMARLSARAPFAMLMIDLDRFKPVNDTLGHATGDELLVEVAGRLRGVCRPADMLFRLGGDELAVLTTLEPDEAHALAGEIVAALGQPFQVGPHTITIGGSVGLATAQRDDHPELVQRMADLALYKAKEEGRGRVELYRDGMIEEAAARRRLECELAGAAGAGQLELYYQPLYELPGCALAGFEALLRWRHPRRGMVPPAEFIPIAEQSGAIIDIGAWVIEEACRQAALWPADLYVSINVSPVQLRSTDILRQLTGALDRHGLTPRRIEVEITETALVEDSEQIAAALAGLRALGVRIAMDDFGTGYSSLAHLREFELDRIKIDRSFINASHTDAGSAAVVRAVTSMAKELAIATTGEGVENEEQLENLIALGCGTAQGYLLGVPLNAAAATALLDQPAPNTRSAAAS